jgi:TolA-binding protein
VINNIKGSSMRLDELNKKIEEMSIEELGQYSMNILSRMNRELDQIDEKIKADNATSSRTRNKETI